MRIYIHIPFCEQKCLYCKFPVVTNFSNQLKKAYLDALKKEISDFFTNNHVSSVESIYLWGGTPSLLALSELSEIILLIRSFVTLSTDCELSIELHPNSVSKTFLRGLHELWINRVSLWVQTLHPVSLEAISRTSLQTVHTAIECLHENPFLHQSADFILGLPYTTKDSVLWEIQQFVRTYPSFNHLSCYMLEAWKYPSQWQTVSPTEEEIGDLYVAVSQMLASEDFSRYEISNFAQSEHECAHNKGYWNHENYRGFGMSAASYVDGSRFSHPDSIHAYLRGEKGSREVLSSEQLQTERLLFGLRTGGVTEDMIADKKGLDDLLADGLLKKSGEKFFVNSDWIFLLDYIIDKLV